MKFEPFTPEQEQQLIALILGTWHEWTEETFMMMIDQTYDDDDGSIIDDEEAP